MIQTKKERLDSTVDSMVELTIKTVHNKKYELHNNAGYCQKLAGNYLLKNSACEL